jgi:prepilin-type N-terminal cleavage/methylation domain-containing protein
MMRTQQSGFTLVELLIVSLLTAVTLAGVYQTLMVQEKSYDTAGQMIRGQESLRTALGILESELREVGSIGGADIGGTDIAVASSDSIVFRAHRKTAFLCKVSRAEKWAIVWTLGDPFAAGDPLLIFVDGDSIRYTDDRWDLTTVSSASSSTDSDCAAYWPDATLQLLRLDNQDLQGVRVGSPMRSFEWVTYSLYSFGHLGWAFGRNRDGAAPAYLVGGLAPPGEGLRFQYFTPDGAVTNDPEQVARVRITVRTQPRPGTNVEPTSMSTNLFLRNN